MAAAWLMFVKFLKRVDLQHLNTATPSNRSAFFQILKDKQRLFFLTYLLTQIAASLPAVLVLFFARDYLDAERYTGLF